MNDYARDVIGIGRRINAAYDRIRQARLDAGIAPGEPMLWPEGLGVYDARMASVQFTRTIHTRNHGDVTAGQIVQCSDADAARYIRNELAVKIDPPKRPTGKGKPATRG